MNAACPHCKKDIEVVTSKDLEAEYGLNMNRQQHLRDQGKMPEPWLAYKNRNIYLRADIQAMKDKEGQESIQKMALNLEGQLQAMSEEERKRTVEELRSLLDGR